MIHSDLINNNIDKLFRHIQPHNQNKLLGTPTAPEYPSFLGGARSFMGARNRTDAFDNRITYFSEPVDVLTHYVPWGYIYAGINHNAANTRVVIEKFRVGMLFHGSEDWVVNDFFPSASNSFGAKHLGYVDSGDGNLPVLQEYIDGVGFGYALTTTKNPIHFWKNNREPIANPEGLRCVYVALTHNTALIDPQGIDDRLQADLHVAVSLDYYPNPGLNYNVVGPLSVSSRFTKVNPYKDIISTASIEGIGQIYRNSDYKGSVLLPINDFLSSNTNTLFA